MADVQAADQKQALALLAPSIGYKLTSPNAHNIIIIIIPNERSNTAVPALTLGRCTLQCAAVVEFPSTPVHISGHTLLSIHPHLDHCMLKVQPAARAAAFCRK